MSLEAFIVNLFFYGILIKFLKLQKDLAWALV